MKSGMKGMKLFFLFASSVCLLVLCDGGGHLSKGKNGTKKKHLTGQGRHFNETKKNRVEGISGRPWKKSFVFGKPNYAEVEKHKRGFLANLANLLNDAEMIATGKVQSALSSFQKKNPDKDNSGSKNATGSTVKNNTLADDENSKINRQLINTTPNSLEKEVDSIEKVTDIPEASNEREPSTDIPHNSLISNLIEDQTVASAAASRDTTTRKENIKHTPSPEEVLSLLNETGDFAPIFAMYHGKVVPLGKIPETTLTPKNSGSGMTRIDESNSALHFAQSSDLGHRGSKEISLPHRATKDVTGTKRTIFDEETTARMLENTRMLQQQHEEQQRRQENGLNKLAEYLKSLDEPNILEKQRPQVVTGTAKDIVETPSAEAEETRKAALFSHVKGVLLDNGKILSLNPSGTAASVNPTSSTPAASIVSSVSGSKTGEVSGDESPSKGNGVEDASPSAIVKKKVEDADSTSRDIVGQSSGQQMAAGGEVADSQKTVTLTLDALKELLKKSESRASLESLLNKKGEKKGEPAPSSPPVEAEDDSSKKVDTNGATVSLAALLNKKPDTKSDTEKDGEEEDPGTIEDFAAGGLKAHNQYRFKHHDESLIWSDDIAAKAQKLAETLADKKTLEIAKDLEKEGYGENVAKVWATFKNAGEAAAKMWYSQSDNYHFDDPHLDENTGQFTQVIWKGTKELGMGVAKSIDDVNNKYVYVTALYRPPGNVESLLRENVLPTGNNTVDVYTTFFKRTGVAPNHNIKRHHINGNKRMITRPGELYEGG